MYLRHRRHGWMRSLFPTNQSPICLTLWGTMGHMCPISLIDYCENKANVINQQQSLNQFSIIIFLEFRIKWLPFLLGRFSLFLIFSDPVLSPFRHLFGFCSAGAVLLIRNETWNVKSQNEGAAVLAAWRLQYTQQEPLSKWNTNQNPRRNEARNIKSQNKGAAVLASWRLQ